MKAVRLFLFILLIGCLGCAGGLEAAAVVALFPPSAKATSRNLTVKGGQNWTDSGMDVQPGDTLHITAKGTIDMGKSSGITPEGASRGWVDTLRALTVPSAGRGALVGRIGNSEAATPFFIGADGTVEVPVAGRLYLTINSDSTETPQGKYEVHIERTPGTSRGGAQSNYDFKTLFAEIDSKLPYRVSDQAENGNAGDLVNFVLLGTQEQVTTALKAAGWIAASKTNQDAVVSAVLATLQKNPYVAVPMSVLYLFGRPQDFGYERAEPVMVATERNHFRIWKAPFATPQNQPVWAGAGTHDIGIEKDDRRPNAITHKIDEDVDKERDFIVATLQQAGQVQAIAYLTRSNPIKSAKTATGGTIQSDGRVAVIVLRGAQTTSAK